MNSAHYMCISDVVDDFARRHSRHLQLANILSNDRLKLNF